MKPVILITLHRRYHELCLALKNIQNKKIFFKQIPSVVLVWADPENGRRWFIDKLIEEKIIDHVIYRYKLPNEDGNQPTTFFESQNIRIGLENVFRLYENAYCIVQASDIIINEFGIRLMQSEILKGAEVVNFAWSNRYTSNAWYTNCFAISSNKEYWPPCSDMDCADVLEKLWYRESYGKRKITTLSNNNNIAFKHEHISENMKQFPIVYVDTNFSCSLFIKGYKSIFRIIKEFIRCIFLGDSNGKSNN